MDDIEVHREGNNAVVSINLVTPINLIRSTASRSNDLTQAYYRVRRATDNLVFVSGERRVVEAEGLPLITIVDEPVRADLLQDVNRRLVISLGKGSKFKVRAGKGERTIEVVLEGLGASVKGPLVSKAAPQADQRYVIALSRSVEPKFNVDTPIPKGLQSFQVFSARRIVDGKQVYETDLGYFATLAEAEAALKQLDRFPQAVIVKLATSKDGKGEVAATVTPDGAAGPDQQASDLLQTARVAYEEQRLDAAVEALNKLLELPASSVTADGQELLGSVRLAQGEPAKAQLEFENYLKQFPSGPGAERVRASLAALQNSGLRPSTTLEPKKPDGSPTVTGSISQYYYGGKSTTATQALRDTDGTILTADQINAKSTTPISGTDQQLLSTNADATWRSRDAERDMKFVVRDQYDYNMIDESKLRGKSRHRNRLTAAFFDYQSLTSGFRSRLGRQSAIWGGEGRYDGATASYAFKPSKLKFSAAAGAPTDKLAQSKRAFAGVSMDADAITQNIGASLFALQRNIDGEVDRRSVGADLRYFSQAGSIMGSTDYDVIFKKLNVASLQGLYMSENNVTVNMLYERRGLSQAQLGQTLFYQFNDATGMPLPVSQTIDDLKRNGYTIQQLRQLVRSNMSYSTHAMTSITVPVTTQWQAGLDLHLNRIGAIAPNEVLPQGQAASGQQRTVGLQAIGSNLYSARDTSVFAGSVLNSSQFKVKQFSYNNLTALSDEWQAEPSVRWQRSTSKDVTTGVDTRTTAWGPGFKASFKPRPTVTLESNLNVDYTHTVGINDDKATRFTYFLGYRYDY